MMNLMMAPLNKELTICKIKKGRGKGKGKGKGLGIGPQNGCSCGCGNKQESNNEDHQANQDRHLANLGFVENAKIEVVSVTDGNFIVKIKDSKVGIGRDIAKKIMVK